MNICKSREVADVLAALQKGVIDIDAKQFQKPRFVEEKSATNVLAWIANYQELKNIKIDIGIA